MSVIAILGSDFDATSRIPEVIDWAQEDVQTLLGSISKHIVCLFVNWYWESLSVKNQYMDSPDRQSFLEACRPGGKYDGIVGIYRENNSARKIGVFDKQLVDGLPQSLKWIAHNGAGYDPVDVHACKARGNHSRQDGFLFFDPACCQASMSPIRQ